MKETKPQLIVITGDIFSGNRMRGDEETFKECFMKFINTFKNLHVPYTFAMGNHDPQALMERGKIPSDFANTNDYVSEI